MLQSAGLDQGTVSELHESLWIPAQGSQPGPAQPVTHMPFQTRRGLLCSADIAVAPFCSFKFKVKVKSKC